MVKWHTILFFIMALWGSVLINSSQPLNDSTVYNISTNVCTASSNGMTITIDPCTIQDVDGRNIQQNINFMWEGVSAQNVGWVFAYPNEIDEGRVYVYENVTKERDVITHNWVNNFLVDKVDSYTNITGQLDECMVGSTINPQKFIVNRYTSNASTDETVYCFTSVSPVNATAFLIAGYNDGITKEAYQTIEPVDRTNEFSYLGYNLRNDSLHYYTVKETIFQPNQIIKTLWIFSPKNAIKSGKWSIFG